MSHFLWFSVYITSRNFAKRHICCMHRQRNSFSNY